jgi:tetratricopeptide (TPR) repeat protein
MSSLDALSGIEFEGLITQLLERMGFRAEMTKASGDGGVDIVATLDQPVSGGRYLIQCKRYAPDSLVGAATVREFYGALTADQRAVKGILITTSRFTAQAKEFASPLPMELIEREQLQSLLEEHGLHASLGRPNSRPLVGASPQAKDRASDMLELAIRMSEQKRYGEAIGLMREATQVEPGDPNLWLWLGICYDYAGLHDEQIDALREAVRLRPNFGRAWLWLGRGLHNVGDLDASIEALTQALAIQSDDPRAWVQLGRAYREKGIREKAQFAFEEAVKVRPDDSNAWFELGLFRYEQREDAAAVQALRTTVHIDPDHATGWELLCHLYKKLGEPLRMHQALMRLEELDSSRARDLRRNLGNLA